MDIRKPCEKCGARDRDQVSTDRESSTKPNGIGEMTFIAQGGTDLSTLESFFPREDNDNHEFAYEWLDAYKVRITRKRKPEPVLTPIKPSPAITQSSLERLTKEDLETRAAELGVELPEGQNKAQWAARIMAAIAAKGGGA
jgi:hypothetical protein